MDIHPMFGELIHAYTRREAIEDGVLVDLMQGEDGEMVRSLGFRFDLAITTTAYNEAIVPSDELLPPHQDRKGRLWDVLWMLSHALRRGAGEGDAVRFTLQVVNLRNGRQVTEVLTLKALCGPGDGGEPVITIMFPEED